MTSILITARIPTQYADRLKRMVKAGEARSYADALNKVVDRYFQSLEREGEKPEVSP